jgi:hypothetical protein
MSGDLGNATPDLTPVPPLHRMERGPRGRGKCGCPSLTPVPPPHPMGRGPKTARLPHFCNCLSDFGSQVSRPFFNSRFVGLRTQGFAFRSGRSPLSVSPFAMLR